MKGKIAEVFESIQGEGIYLGEKQLFVRFFGCNLSCKFCDTKLNAFIEYEPEELLAELKLYEAEHHSISFTGGEPLLQKDFLKEILPLTRRDGFLNYLETNGTLPEALEEVIDDLDFIAMDLKFPSSTGLGDFWQSHRQFLKVASRKEVFLKAVICHSTQKEDLIEALNLIQQTNDSAIFVLQPNCYEDDDAMREKLEEFKNICVKSGITAFIIPQIHRISGVR